MSELTVFGAPDFLQGIAHGIDIDVYHTLPGISKTGLDLIDRSPAHYFGLYLDPNRPPPKERAGQLEGQLAHCAVLEPDAFALRYVTVPRDAPRRPTDAQWNAKAPSVDSQAAMHWWREFNARAGDKQVISNAQYETAMRQGDAMRALPEVAEVLQRGRAEVSAMWVDEATGELCRCRPDWVAEFGGERVALLDVKTCADASGDEFRRQIARKRYHVQDAFYTDGYATASGSLVMGFVFVAVESEWPFAANAVMLENRSQEQGRAAYRRNLAAYSACRRANLWPGYCEKIQVVELPRWAMSD